MPVADLQEGPAFTAPAGGTVVVAYPDQAGGRVDAVEAGAVGREPQAVGQVEVIVDHGDRPGAVDPQQLLLAVPVVQGQAADQEPASRVAAAVVEPAAP